MAGRSIEYNLPRGNMWQPVSPANAVKAQMKARANQRLPLELRRNRNTYRAAVKVAERKNQIRAAHAAAAAAPMTAANIAFQERLARRAEELKVLQNIYKSKQKEIKRQRHVNSEQARAARQALNNENEEASVNYNEVNSRNHLNNVITELRSQVYALEHADPVNSVELEKTRALLEVAEAKQMYERIQDELPGIISLYGEDSAMAQDMYITEQEALERSIDAVAHLEALHASGGRRRRTRKHKNRCA